MLLMCCWMFGQQWSSMARRHKLSDFGSLHCLFFSSVSLWIEKKAMAMLVQSLGGDFCLIVKLKKGKLHPLYLISNPSLFEKQIALIIIWTVTVLCYFSCDMGTFYWGGTRGVIKIWLAIPGASHARARRCFCLLMIVNVNVETSINYHDYYW